VNFLVESRKQLAIINDLSRACVIRLNSKDPFACKAILLQAALSLAKLLLT
jgi:hypothetical protein